MKCPSCGCVDSKVIDSRENEDSTSIRRRRECIKCGKRYTTYETIEIAPIMVVKKSGIRELYSREKVKNGIMSACFKRPISTEQIDKILDEVERKITDKVDQEISSEEIGNIIMDKLKDLDDVAYIRFAAVYREFRDINSWFSEIKDILKNKK